MLESLLAKLRGIVGNIAPGPETLARREASALRRACVGLLMEVARLDSRGAEQKHEAVAKAMRQQFAIADEGLAPMIANAGRPENRLTSYFRPVALLNERLTAGQKARFIEQLWRVAMADGAIDMYEEQLVRKLADLLYVAHADFILARRRVENGGAS